jgi:hypothetical protein
MSNRKYFLRLFPALVLACIAALLTGCSNAPVAHTLTFTVDKSQHNKSVQVDIFGINATTDLPKWEAYVISEYWQPNNTARSDLDRVSLHFGRKHPTTQSLSEFDSHWERWLATGATYAVVIADIPGVTNDRAGNADPRRLILPLNRRLWDKDDDGAIKILIQESGLRLITPRENSK